MKISVRIFSFISAFAIFVCLAFGGSAYTEIVTEKTNIPPKVVFLGDSIAAGMGLEGYSGDNLYNCNSYANILGKKYKKALEGKCKATMINKAVSGEATYDLLDHLQNGEFDSTLKDSNAVVISIGANDIINVVIRDVVRDVGFDFDKGTSSIKTDTVTMLKVVKDVTLASGKVDEALEVCNKNLNTIIKEIKKRTNAVIIVQTVYNPLDSLDKYKIVVDYTNKKVDKLNEIIINNSGEGKNYIICDVAGKFRNKSNELTNIPQMDIHPNPEGHKLIAQLVDEKITSNIYTYERKIEIPDSSVDLKNTEGTGNQAGFISVVTVVILVGAVVILTVVRLIIRRNKTSS